LQGRFCAIYRSIISGLDDKFPTHENREGKWGYQGVDFAEEGLVYRWQRSYEIGFVYRGGVGRTGVRRDRRRGDGIVGLANRDFDEARVRSSQSSRALAVAFAVGRPGAPAYFVVSSSLMGVKTLTNV
jgi:hypothetical protein